jgi:hypothetical protein
MAKSRPPRLRHSLTREDSRQKTKHHRRLRRLQLGVEVERLVAAPVGAGAKTLP